MRAPSPDDVVTSEEAIALFWPMGESGTAGQILEGSFSTVSTTNFQFCQLEPHLEALAEIYTTYTFLQISDIKLSIRTSYKMSQTLCSWFENAFLTENRKHYG